MSDIKRECGRCRIDQTPLGRGIYAVHDFHGNGIDLFCVECIPLVTEMLNDIARAHGAIVEPDGRFLCSPQGTPFIRSYGDLMAAVIKSKRR
jgi:hypothetical protein